MGEGASVSVSDSSDSLRKTASTWSSVTSPQTPLNATSGSSSSVSSTSSTYSRDAAPVTNRDRKRNVRAVNAETSVARVGGSRGVAPSSSSTCISMSRRSSPYLSDAVFRRKSHIFADNSVGHGT